MTALFANLEVIVAFVAVPALVHYVWIKTHKTENKTEQPSSFNYSYSRSLRYLYMCIGTMFMVFGVIVPLSMLLGTAEPHGGSSSIWSIPFSAVFVILGNSIRKSAKRALDE